MALQPPIYPGDKRSTYLDTDFFRKNPGWTRRPRVTCRAYLASTVKKKVSSGSGQTKFSVLSSGSPS